MQVSYRPLFVMLAKHNLDKSALKDLLKMSPSTIAKFKKGETVGGKTLKKLCDYFKCKIEDIVEYLPD